MSPTSRTARWVAAAPLAGAVFLACLGTVSTALLLAGSFDGLLALGLGLVLTAIALLALGPDREELTRKAVALDLAALALAAGFAGLQAATSGQNIAVERDPGVYAVTAKWLTEHDNVDIDTQARLFGPPDGITYPSAGFGPTTTPDHVYAQGAHVVPAVVAVAGRVGGDGWLFRANALIGGLALLAAYGLGRRAVGRGAALAGMGLLALILPSLAFSRDVYTEPYSQLLLLGGLALLWRTTPGRPAQWAVAGLVLGGSCLARIDAFLALPFVVTYGGLLLAVTRRRGRTAVDVAALLGAAAVPALLGWLDLSRLSPGYYRDLHPDFSRLMLLLVVSLVAAVLLVGVAWATPVVGWLRGRADGWWLRLGTIAGAAVVLVGLVLAARPLFYTGHGITQKPVQDVIVHLQRAAGLPEDGTRSYAENSVTWLALYLGPLAAAAALVGTALLLRRALAHRDLRAVPYLLVFLSTAGLYLVKPSITPDQIWAMRRYVPSVLPVAAFAATFALGLLLARWTGPRRRLAAAVLAVAVLGPVLFVSRPFLLVTEYDHQRAEVERVCAALPGDAAVLVVGEFLSARYPMTLRAFCDVPAVAQRTLDPVRAGAARATLATGGRRLYVLSAGEDLERAVPGGAGTAAPISRIDVRLWPRVLEKRFAALHLTVATPPRQAPSRPRELFLGLVGADGTVVSWVTP